MKSWGGATFGDAILDRLVHHAHTLSLKGASMRRTKPGKEEPTPGQQVRIIPPSLRSDS